MRNILSFILVSGLISGTACAQNQARVSTGEIKNDFIESVTANWEDFKVCEYYSSTENKKEFIGKSIDLSLTRGVEKIDPKEIFVSNQESGETLHLGVVVLSYSSSGSNNMEAIQVDADGYLGNTKILTRYLLKKVDYQLIVYYSETYIDERVEKFLAGLE
jgi:hypothetical protein